MAWFERKKDKNPSELARIAATLERLCILYELDLHSRGVTTVTGEEQGETFLTDSDAIAQREYEDELRRLYGLREQHDFRVPGDLVPSGAAGSAKAKAGKAQEVHPSGRESLFAGSGSWGLGLGPEGAEGFEPGAEAAWLAGLGPPSAFAGPGEQAQQARESRADSGEGSERGPERDSNSPSKEAGE